jgi:putative Mg2+ transporter-C (MgtC) family protein
LAAALGGVVGLERELSGHRAGLRTHISVALGAALFAAISAYGFEEFLAPRNNTNFQIDVTRVVSQIVVGVGFLGGGTILKEGATVRGLTTAASLWVTAAIGTAVALGSIAIGLVTTAILLGSLVLLRLPRRWIRTHLAHSRDMVLVRVRDGTDAGSVVSAIYGLEGVEVRDVTVRKSDDGTELHAYLVADRGVDIDRHLTPLAARDDVISVDAG